MSYCVRRGPCAILLHVGGAWSPAETSRTVSPAPNGHTANTPNPKGQTMDTMSAYLNSVASQGKPQRVFDWNKAARILRDRGARRATAGLALDMEWTAGEILTDGEPNTESDTYLSSNWATPVLVIDGEEIECWAFARDTGWDANTKWPESAIKILRGEEK